MRVSTARLPRQHAALLLVTANGCCTAVLPSVPCLSAAGCCTAAALHLRCVLKSSCRRDQPACRRSWWKERHDHQSGSLAVSFGPVVSQRSCCTAPCSFSAEEPRKFHSYALNVWVPFMHSRPSPRGAEDTTQGKHQCSSYSAAASAVWQLGRIVLSTHGGASARDCASVRLREPCTHVAQSASIAVLHCSMQRQEQHRLHLPPGGWLEGRGALCAVRCGFSGTSSSRSFDASDEAGAVHTSLHEWSRQLPHSSAGLPHADPKQQHAGGTASRLCALPSAAVAAIRHACCRGCTLLLHAAALALP